MPYTIEYTGEWTEPLEALLEVLPMGEDWNLTLTMEDGTVHDVSPVELTLDRPRGTRNILVVPYDRTKMAADESAEPFEINLDGVKHISM